MIARFLRYDGEYECYQVEPEWVSDIICSVKGQYFFVRPEFSINGADYKHVDIIYENDSEKIYKFNSVQKQKGNITSWMNSQAPFPEE